MAQTHISNQVASGQGQKIIDVGNLLAELQDEFAQDAPGKTIKEWCKETGLKRHTLQARFIDPLLKTGQLVQGRSHRQDSTGRMQRVAVYEIKET